MPFKDKEAAREYKRRYREMNRDRIRQQSAIYHINNRDGINQRHRESYKKNLPREKSRKANYYQNNIEERRQQSREYYHTNKDKKATYQQKNRVKIQERQRRKIKFKSTLVRLDINPRKGICSECGRGVGTGIKVTNMHHIEYHNDDVLKDTIELCVRCHNERHKFSSEKRRGFRRDD